MSLPLRRFWPVKLINFSHQRCWTNPFSAHSMQLTFIINKISVEIPSNNTNWRENCGNILFLAAIFVLFLIIAANFFDSKFQLKKKISSRFDDCWSFVDFSNSRNFHFSWIFKLFSMFWAFHSFASSPLLTLRAIEQTNVWNEVWSLTWSKSNVLKAYLLFQFSIWLRCIF